MASQPINPKTQEPFRPNHLPPPTVLPLRHCSHNEDSSPIDEASCLLSLFSPSANPDSKKNKEHYILAAADPPSPEKVAASATGDQKKRNRDVAEAKDALRRAKTLRIGARSVPGVPVVYVKRSVMVLEPMSSPSEHVREGFEEGKFRAGIEGDSSLGKRKRSDEDGKNRKGGVKKAKGPNPLSVKKSKKVAEGGASGKPKSVQKGDGDGEAKQHVVEASEKQPDGEPTAPKPKRKRRHHKSAKRDDDGPGADENPAESME
jgi:U3 small nucleolar RNA-associated protein 23